MSNTQIPASQEDGNSCVQPVGDAPARRMTPHDLRAATEMLDTIKNLTDDIREWQTASHCCVSPIVTGLYDTISIEVTDAVRTASINATRERIDQIRGWLGELGVDLDQDGGAA